MFRSVRSASGSRRPSRRRLVFECIEARRLLAADIVNPWHNAANPPDVTGETFVTAADSLHIAHYLQEFGPGPVPDDAAGPPFFDTNNDGLVTGADQELVDQALQRPADGPLQNPKNALDVDDNQRVDMHDVLPIRSYLDRVRRAVDRPDAGLDYFLDVNGDGQVTADDQRLVAAFFSPDNTAPVAHDALYRAEAGTPLVADHTADLNYRDENVDPLRTVLVSGPGSGTLLLRDDGTFIYTPDNGFVGQDTFTFQADDGREENNLSNIATVTIDVRPFRPKPIALPDFYEVTEGGMLVVGGAGLLANDTPGQGEDLRVALITRPANGTLTFANHNSSPYVGAFNYIPDPGFVGVDTFVYQALEQTLDRTTWEFVNTWSPFVTVTIEVKPADDGLAALDVSADGWVTALDALLVINFINAGRAGHADGESTPSDCDVSGDGVVSAADVLAIISYLNAGLGTSSEAAAETASPEGESSSSGDQADLDELVLLLATDADDLAGKRRQV